MSWHASLTLATEVAHRRAGDVDIRVWVPACGDGLVAYVLAAAFTEILGVDEMLARVHVCATDASSEGVRHAREGRYPADRTGDLPDVVADRYFPSADGERAFVDDLRGAISFARNDLDRDRPLHRVDLLDLRELGPGASDGPAARTVVSCLRPGGLVAASGALTGLNDLDLLPVEGIDALWERPIPQSSAGFGQSWRPAAPIRVVVVNDHELFVRGLGVLLESMFGRFLTVVAVSHDPAHALSVISDERPDVVIVDVSSPGSAELPAAIGHLHPGMPVLVLTDDPHEAWREVVRGGAAGVVPRSASAHELVGPLLAVAEGLAVLPPEAVRLLGRGVPPEHVELFEGLDEGERQLWAWVAQGLQDNEIADRLFVSARTVKRRVGALLRRLGVSRRVEAAELAGRLGLLARIDPTVEPVAAEPVAVGLTSGRA